MKTMKTKQTILYGVFGTSYNDNINAIAYGGGKFIAVGADGKMAYSNY